MHPVLQAWLLTVALETPVVALLFPGRRGWMALVCVIATSGTNLYMNIGLPRFFSDFAYGLLLGEALALVIEALIYGVAARKLEIVNPFVKGWLASALANSLSYGVGIAVL